MALVMVAAALWAQDRFSARRLLELERPLESSEISIVLKSVQAALDGRTYRLGVRPGDSGIRVLMGPDGRPRIIGMTSSLIHGVVGGLVPGAKTPPTSTEWREDVTTIREYPGLPARRCDGSGQSGELVIEYTSRDGAGWTVSARARNVLDSNITRPLSMLQGHEDVSSGERREVDGRWARALVAPWIAPANTITEQPAILTGDPIPNVVREPGTPAANDATQSLWIDTETLLPLRWEVTKPDPLRVLQSRVFNYESFQLRPPAGVDAPECIR
jgi:hypothetical protein